MKFHIFAYLRFTDHQASIRRLVSQLGATPQNTGYKSYLKSPTDFLRGLAEGIYTDFVENEPNKVRPLSTVVSVGEGVHQRFTLELAGVFSPERKRLTALSARDESQELTSSALTNATQTYEGKHGFSSAQPNQRSLAEAGWVVATLEGFVITDDYARRVGMNPDTIRSEQRDAVLALLNELDLYFAFSANQDDYELWHEGPIIRFPPEEPWRYLWSFTVFGPELVGEIGRTSLMNAPATEIHSSGNSVALQAFDYCFHPREIAAPNYHERELRACELLRDMGFTLPYTTFVSAKDLHFC